MCLAAQITHRNIHKLQELALAQRRSLLEAVWQSGEGPTGDAVYSRDVLLGSTDLNWQDVQWAANIVRSRYAAIIILEGMALLAYIGTTGLSASLTARAELQNQ